MEGGMAEDFVSDNLRAAIRAACPDIPETDEGMVKLGDRWFRLAEPSPDEKDRRSAIRIVEVPTYTVTININPNKTAEG